MLESFDDIQYSTGILFLVALVSFAFGIGILIWYVALPAQRLTRFVKRTYGKKLGKNVSSLSRSELRFLLVSFEKMVSDLESKEAELRTMAATVAHEVRNSAAVIRGASQNLKKKGRFREINDISREAQALEHMATGFLDFTRPIAPDFQEGDLVELVKTSLSAHSSAARKRGVRLRAGNAKKILFRGDTHLLKMALRNLISNAVRASSKGGSILVAVKKTKSKTIELRVKDSGEGIALAAREKIFEPFYSQGGGGTGMGLPLARRIAEAHGGRLELEASGPKGSCFLLILPNSK